MTFAQYLIREIGRTMAVVLGVLVTLFAAYSANGFLADALNGLMPADTIAALIALKALISLEVLIPVSLFVSVVLAFGRLYSDSEFAAMFALGLRPARVMGIVLMLAGPLAVIVAVLSLTVRPWAYQRSHELSRQAETLLDFDYMQAGTFYVGDHGDRVIFVEHRAGPRTPAQNVFVRTLDDGHSRVIFARDARQLPKAAGESATDVLMNDAHVYDFLAENRPSGAAVAADQIVVPIGGLAARPIEYASTAAPTPVLAASGRTDDLAELQWRLSTPISTLLLGLLGIPLSRANPRQSKYAKIGTAILLYSFYYLICTSARTWVQHGTIGAFPGIWWAPAMLGTILATVTYGGRLRPRLGRAAARLMPAPLLGLLPGRFAKQA